jgi:membrane-associated phospholipid phosphatase
MDWTIFHQVNEFATDYTWLAHAVNWFETIGVVLYAAAVIVLWLSTRPGEERGWKIASLAAGLSAFVALGINQVIAAFWHRPRPYESHAGVYHLTQSHDPSFPSDHASAAFGIAFGIFFVNRRVGRWFLAVAALIAVGRVVVGAHYPADVLASVLVGAAAAAIVVFVFKRPLFKLVLLLERISDPVARRYWDRRAATA